MNKIDYDLTKIRAFAFDVDGVLSPTVVPMAPDGRPVRMANVKDGFAMKEALRAGYMIAIITGADTEAVARRMELIGISDVYLCAKNKLEVLQSWMYTRGLEPDGVAFAGDDVPDMECMQYVGLSVAPADADETVKRIATYVSPAIGGYGVARDLIRQTLTAAGKWPDKAQAYG